MRLLLLLLEIGYGIRILIPDPISVCKRFHHTEFSILSKWVAPVSNS